MTRSLVVGTAGHIDHGKSALVRALTGTDPDRLKEEQARGITIDLGFAHASIDGSNLAFVDVPGHERFVKNMLAGVGGIDAVLLVVAADESVMPQTREHFAICRLLHVQAGVVALTKCDLVDAETIDLVRMEVRELVAGSALANAPVLAVSAKTGQGLDELRAALHTTAQAAAPRSAAGWPRLPIDRVFTIRGFGTVVTGTLTSGTLRTDEELVLLPAEQRVKVRGLQVHGAPVGTVDAGHRVAVNLGGVDVADIRRGDTLTVPGAFEITRRFDVRLDLLADAPPLKHGSRVRFHHGTAEILGRVALASEGFGRIRLESPAVLTRGDRFILRAYSPPVTIGGGVVLDPAPARGAIRTAAGATRFERLDASTREAARVFLDERAASGLSIGGLAARAGVPLEEAGAIADALGEAHEAVAVGDTLVSAAIVADLEKRLIALVAAHHEREPLSEGLPREEARERLFARAADGVFERVLADLAAANRLAVRDQLAIPGRGVSLSPEEAAAHERLARAYRDAGLAPPDVAAVAASVHVDARIADRVIKVLVRQRRLIRLDTLLFDADALARLKEEVAGWKAGGAQARVDVATFKDRYGLSRKYAIPLLEWLDRERVTRRIGDGRVVL